ncbi:MAG: hypothetical protein HUU26_05605 [Gemmatimonadaceae bacterium]|nr:hypothetical protein [Gemmatimonadaceae bacterium]
MLLLVLVLVLVLVLGLGLLLGLGLGLLLGRLLGLALVPASSQAVPRPGRSRQPDAVPHPLPPSGHRPWESGSA